MPAGDDPHAAQREAAAAELRRVELASLLACMVSPLVGGWMLSWLMENLTDGNRYLCVPLRQLGACAASLEPTH